MRSRSVVGGQGARTQSLPPTNHWVRRQSLLKRLDERPAERLVLIEAPAGYGKSVFVSQLCDHEIARRRYVASVCLESGVDARGLRSLIAAALSESGLSALQQDDRLLPRFQVGDGPCTLIVDNSDYLTADIFNTLLDESESLPPGVLKLVISCRRNPGVDLSRQAMHGALLQLGPQQLELTHLEVSTALSGRLKPKHLDQFVEHIAGWPAALGMISSSPKVAGTTDPAAEDLDRIGKAYGSQVLICLSSEEREFIEQAIALRFFRPAMMDHVASRRDSATVIRKLHFRYGVLVQTDPSLPDTYTVHPLLKRYWLANANQEAQIDWATFYGRAAEWSYGVGDKIEAVEYAMNAGNCEQAVEYFEKAGGLTICLTDGLSALTEITTLMLGSRASEFPRVLAAWSLVELKNGRIQSAHRLFQRARQHLPNGKISGDPLSLELSLIELLLSQYGHWDLDSESLIENVQRLIAWSDCEPALRGFISLFQCLIHMQTGAFELARYFGTNALAAAKRCRSSYEELHIYNHLGAERLVAGSRDEALAFYRRAFSIIQEHFSDNPHLEFRSHVLLGELFWEFGDAAAAKKHIKYVLGRMHPTDAPVEISMAAFKMCCEYLLLHAGETHAVAYLLRVRQNLLVDDRQRLIAFVDALLLFLYARTGLYDKARRQAADLTPRIEKYLAKATWREREMFTLAAARTEVLNRQAAVASERLDGLIDFARSSSNRRLEIYAGVEKAVVELEDSRDGDALRTLDEVFQRVEMTQYIRPLINRVELINPVLMQVQSLRPGSDQAIRHILAATSAPDVSQRHGGLNTRQREILVELCKKQTDKGIAKNLGLSPDGVRYHLKAIYTQLSVSTRAAAIRLARERGLV